MDKLQMLQPKQPQWYPSPGDIVGFSVAYARQLPPIGKIITIDTFGRDGMTGNAMAQVEFFKLGLIPIPTGYLYVITNPEVIEAYNRATDAIKTLETLLQHD